MKNQKFRATNLRTLLGISFGLAAITLGVIFYMGLQSVRSYAVEVSQATEDAAASGRQVESLQRLQQQLGQTRALVQKADQIFASADNYQTQSVTDLQRYASAAGVSITGTTFTQGTQPADSRQVTITLAQPVSYAKLARFLQLIETSMPKMQVAGVKISRPANPSGDAVSVDPLAINISVR